MSGNYLQIIGFFPIFYLFYTMYGHILYKIKFIFEANTSSIFNIKMCLFLLYAISNMLNFIFSGYLDLMFDGSIPAQINYILPNEGDTTSPGDSNTLSPKTKLDVLNEIKKEVSKYDKTKLPDMYKKSESGDFNFKENMSINKPNAILIKRGLPSMHIDLPFQKRGSLEQNKEFLENIDTSLVLYKNQKVKFNNIINNIIASKEL
jgi:hypothetical protein